MSATTPTIVLVHGAFTDASVWHAAIKQLHQRNYHVVAPAMPMHGLASDAAYLHGFLTTIEGPIVIAGHSYGGAIIARPDALTAAVRALVFVAAFLQDRGETAGELIARFPTWRTLPSWTLVATADNSIPPAALRFMRRRAGSNIVELASSHALPVSHPADTADIIIAAVTAVANTDAAAA